MTGFIVEEFGQYRETRVEVSLRVFGEKPAASVAFYRPDPLHEFSMGCPRHRRPPPEVIAEMLLAFWQDADLLSIA